MSGEGAQRAMNERLMKLRGYRAVRERAKTLHDDCAIALARVERVSEEHDAVGAALDACVPEALKGRVWVERCVRGSATLAARDAGTRYALDRWLRGGGLEALRGECRAAVRSVKTRIVN